MATTSDKVSDKIGTPLQDGDAVNRLEVIIYNLISIGAWESARGQLQALAISTTGRDKAKDILKAIILNPKSFWNESLAVPSIDHLASLALQDYIELFPDNLAEVPSSLEDQFNFNLLLYTSRLCDGYSPQISDWLKGYYLSHVISRSTSSISLHTFNQTVLGFIRTLLLSHPPIAHSLISYLIIKDDPHYLPNNESLQLLYISCIDIYWSEIESCDDDVKKKELIDKIHLMLLLVDPQGDMSKLLKKLDNLLVRLIQSQVKIEDNLAFTFESIYGCFIGRSSPILIQRFQDIEEFMKGYIGKGPATIMSREEEDNNDDRWKVEFYKCLRKNRHFLEKTLDAGLKLITNGQLDKLVELMEDSTYHRLKPLLLLLGWDRYSDTGSGQKLLNILWPSSDISEPVLYNGCCKLAFQIGLVDWCLQKARPFLPDSSSLPSSAGDVFQGLKSHSILYVLHHSTPLSSLNPTEVIEILKLRPDSSSLTKPLSPTFQNLEITSPLKSNSSASLLPEQERDINTFRGFHCLKMILEAIWHSVLLANGLFESKEKGNPSETNEAADGDKPKAVRKLDLDESNIESSVIKTKCDSSYDKEVTQRLSDAKIHLSSIFPLHFRLEILENIFSLLFLSSEDIQVFNEVKAAHDIIGSTQSLNSKSSEAESDSLNTNTTFIKKQKGFLVDEKIAHDILQLLNDAIFELTAARFSLFSSNGGQGGSIDHISTGAMVSSISPSLLNQRSVKLQKQINEAKWRLELVSSKSGVSTSHASLSRPVGVSSDEDSLSDISEPEEEEKTEEKMTVRGKVKDQITRTDNSKGPSPRLPRSHRLSKPRSGSDGSKGGRPTAASTDEVYESSGHCADVEEPTPFSLIKKRKFRPRAGPTLSKLRKSSKNSTAQKGSGIIYQMLASPNSLLCKCLRYGNYHKGQEVVKMFNMEDTIEESLVQFSEQFEMVSRELADQSQSPTPHPSPSLTPKNSKGSKDNQSQALQAAILNASDHYPSLESLHRLLVPTTLSKMLFAGNEEIDSASLDTPLLESLTQNVPSLVMLDLLISNKINGQTAKKIVKMAVDRSMVALDSLPSDSHTSGRRSYQERSASQDKPSPRGPLSLLLTLSEVSGYFILPASAPDNAGLLSITSPHHLLFQFILPLTIESVQYWKEFNNCYQEKREVVERVIQKSSTHSDPLLFLSSSQSPKDKTNDVIFTELIKAIELFPRHNPSLKPAADDRVYIQYIYYLIAYLTKFVQLLRNSLDLDSTQTCPSQLLCVLKESPIELIGRLVFEKSISPQRLEKFMSDLPHLKIVEVIVKCCCPSIPSTVERSKVTKDEQTIFPLNSGIDDLSVSGDEETDPCELSHKLFNKMIATLRGLSQTDGTHIDTDDLLTAAKTTEMKKIFSCTCKLATISLASLKGDTNRQISFYTNVANLLYAHSLMVFVQECQLPSSILIGSLSLNVLQSDRLAQVAYFSRVGYFIGELGLVSLYDLHYVILRHGLSLPKLDRHQKINIRSPMETFDPWIDHAPSQPDPRVLYVISNGTLSSPLPRLLMPEHVHSELDSAESKYLRANVTFDVSTCTIKIPKLLDDHRNDFIPRKSQYDFTNPFHHLSNVALIRYVVSKLPKESAEQLSKILEICDMGKGKRSNDLKLVVLPEDMKIGYEFPSMRRNTLGDGASPQLERRKKHTASIRQTPRRYEKLKPYKFTEETMTFVQQQAPSLASIVSLLCPPDNLKEDNDLQSFSPPANSSHNNEILESLHPSHVAPAEESKTAFMSSLHFRRTKIRQPVELKRSNSATDESKIVFPRHNPVWQNTFNKLLGLFIDGSPLKKFFSLRVECFKGVLPWDSAIQEAPDDIHNSDPSISLRKLAVLPSNSEEMGQACSFVIRKLVRHSLIHEALRFLRSEPMIDSSWSLQHIVNCTCSAGLIYEVHQKRDHEMADGVPKINPLVLVHCHDNKEEMVRIVLSSLEVWDVFTCVDLLMYIRCHLSPQSPFMGVVSHKLQQLFVYEKIMKMVDIKDLSSSWSTWPDLSFDSNEKKEKVLKVLLKHKEYNLAREWSQVHRHGDDIIAQIEEEYIYDLLEGFDESDPYTAQGNLEDLPTSDMKQKVCQSLLERCFNLESHLMILQFLLEHQLYQSEEELKFLINKFLGIKVLLNLPHFIRENYRQLMSSPLLIVEQLLIDIKIEWCGKVIKVLSKDKYLNDIDDSDTPLLVTNSSTVRGEDESKSDPFVNLLMFYAEKALEFPLPSVSDSSRATSPSVPPTPFSRPYERMKSPSQSPSVPPTPRGHHRRGSSQTFFSDKNKGVVFEPPPVPPRKEEWISDASAKYCQVCKSTYFGMFNRRHHCRRCGRVSCSPCSDYFMEVKTYEGQQRVCKDCFNHHLLISGSSDDHVSLEHDESAPCLSSQSPWQLLPGDPHYNQNLRSEFYYNESPSTPLCLAIIDLMEDRKMAAGFILHCCHNVSMQLVPDNKGKVNEEIDHYFTISIIENLLLNAKLRFIEDSSSIELCDTYLSRVDLLRSLVSSSYSEIPSIQEMTKPELARRVRDRLIADDRYNLAIEVSTKCQLDTAPVWTAWGMASIKAGEFSLARDKFRHCLQSSQSLRGSNYLLDRIIEQILACPLSSVEQCDDWNEMVKHTFNLTEDQNIMNSTRFEECCYYLKTYGTPGAMIGFLSKHHCWRLACQEIIKNRCPSDVFLDHLWLPAIKTGQLSSLEENMTLLDPTLSQWDNYLVAVCRFLSQRRLFHVLYQTQIFMKDYVRAGMTCIKFYIGFSGRDTTIEDLHKRRSYLDTAEEHFMSAIDVRQPKGKRFGVSRQQFEENGRGGAKGMSVQDLQTHIHTISLQRKVAEILYRVAKQEGTLSRPLPLASSSAGQEGGVQPATLFSTGMVRGEVTCHMLIACQEMAEGFPIALEMICLYRLPSNRVFTEVAKQLALKERYVDIRVLVQCIEKSCLASPELNDEVCMSAIKVLSSQSKEARVIDKHLDKLISMLKNNTNRVRSLIQCGKLKNAYLVAINAKLPDEVEHIADVAAKAGQLTVKDICEKWLQQYRANRPH